ncbi:MAG TPA: polysaccharide deacetylase family protein [Terriglobia bacterium]|nr:polysaccharide deacetylase family protein [Terriglobia bacterium]
MLRAIGKTCFACAYTLTSPVRRLARRAPIQRVSPFIVCYHRVVDSYDRARQNTIPAMLISTSMLEQHIDWLAKRFTFVSLDEIGSHLAAQRPFKKPAAAITFDDGYSDVFHNAYPLLKRKGIPAAVFVVTGLVGTGQAQVFDRLYSTLRHLHATGRPLARTVAYALQSLGVHNPPLERLEAKDHVPFRIMTALLNSFPQNTLERVITRLEANDPSRADRCEEMAPLTWDMIQTMHRDGITIGSHTQSHLLLTKENADLALTELSESRRTLEKKLSARIEHFAYPDGRFNPAVTQAVSAAGYRYGYGICRSRDEKLPLLTIPRKVLWERSCLNAFGQFSSVIMNCHAYGAFDAKGHCEHDHSLMMQEGMHANFA